MGNAVFEVGVACGKCDAFSPMGAAFCPLCGHGLALEGRASPAVAPPVSAPAESARLGPVDVHEGAGGVSRELVVAEELGAAEVTADQAPADRGRADGGRADRGRAPYASSREDDTRRRGEEDSVEQAKYYVCDSCMTPVPSGHKFCGRCGASVPESVLHMSVDYFSDMQNTERARVVVIRGDESEGLSYHLKASEHVVGRSGQIEFANDEYVSPRHANLFYRDGKLFVRDEQSLNGVFVRVRGSVPITPGDLFIAGEQLFRLDPTPKASDAAEADGTFFYSSPKYPSAFRINQILDGGALGMTVCTRGNALKIGREDGDLNFPADIFMSGSHCTVEEKDGQYTLTDHGSRNGTYLRIKAEQPLGHGDYLFIGRKLLRVELNTN